MALGTIGALVAGSLGSAAIGAIGAKKAGDATVDAAKTNTQLQKAIYNETSGKLEPFYEGGLPAWDAFLYELGLGDAPQVGGNPLSVEEFQEQDGFNQSFRNTDQDRTVITKTPNMVTRFRVGDEVFGSRDEADAYATENGSPSRTYGGYSQSPMAKYLLKEGTDSINAAFAKRGGFNSGAALEALEKNRRDIITADTDKYFDRLLGTAGMSFDAATQQGSAGRYYASAAGNATMAGAQGRANAYTGMAGAAQTGIADMAGIYGYFNNPLQQYAQPRSMPTTGLY